MSDELNKALNAIKEVGAELADPNVSIERVHVGWTRSRNKRYVSHRVVEPGLIEQLHRAAVDRTSQPDELATSRPKPKSRPPLAVEALSAYDDICRDAHRWVKSIGSQPNRTPENNVGLLVVQRDWFDLDTAEGLLLEMRQWKRWCLVFTGQDEREFRPRCACLHCDEWASIRINVTKRLAYCAACQTQWDGDEVVALARQVGGELAVLG